MISRRDALKLSAAGLIAPAALVGCGEEEVEVLDYPDQPITQTDPNDVPMFRGNAAHTGAMLGTGPTPVGQVQESWNLTIYNFQRPLLFSKGVIYAFIDFSVVGLDANSGEQVFEFDYGANDGAGMGLDSASQAVSDGILYLSLKDGIRAVDPTTARTLWTYETEEAWSTPSLTLSNDTMYTVLSDKLVAIDSAVGRQRWRFKLKEGYARPSPAFDNGTVYAASADTLYAVDSRSGKEAWKFICPEPDEYDRARGDFGSPVVSDSLVFCPTSDGRLFAVDQLSGEEKWQYATEGGVIGIKPPAVENGVAYAVSQDGNLYALDAKTGSKTWNFRFGDSDQYLQPPVVADGVVYIVPDDHTWIAVDASTGGELGRVTISDQMFNIPPLVTNGHVYMSWWAELHAIRSY